MTRVFRRSLPFAACILAATLPGTATPAADRAPLLLASDSAAFDEACANYYRQGNDPAVAGDGNAPESYCECLAGWYARQGFGVDALDFFARTYSEDLTTFIGEYPQGDAWMRESATAELMCRKSG